MKHKITHLLIIILLFTMLAGCEKLKTSSQDKVDLKKREAVIVSEQGGYIVSAVTRDAIILNPVLINDVASNDIANMIFEGLVKYDDNLELVGVLAENWEILDQGLEVIFHLKRNVRWHDGVMFTAYDVKFTFETIMKFKNYTGNVGGKSQLFTEFEYVNDINILDDYTFKVSYKLPFARTIDIWINSIIPRHIFENYKTLEEFTQSTYNRNPVGTGKYKFSLWQPDERIILERNNNYHGKSAYIDKIIYSVNPEQAILYLDTRLGRNDVAEFTPTQFGRLLKNNEDLEKIMPVKYTGNHYMYMGYNLKNPLLSNPEIRKALTMAINRQEIIDGVLEGYGQVCYGPFYPFSWAFNKELNPTPYSPVDAMKIFQDFGWEDTNQDGWLDKNGKIFEFKVMVDRSEPNRNMALKFIQRNLKNIGVKLEIEPVEWNILVNNLYTKNFDAVLVGWQLSLDPDIYSVWHTDGPMNFISYSNPRVDELLERARKTFDRDIRRESYNQVHRLIKNDMPYTFLYIDEVLGAVNRRIKGVETKNTGLNSVAEWYVNYRTVIY